MYPEWITTLVGRETCRCRSRFTVENLHAVGVHAPVDAWSSKPLAVVLLRCPLCGEMTEVKIDQPCHEILSAVSAFYLVTEVAPPAEPPPFTLPSQKDRPETKPPQFPPAPTPKAGPVRPSRRPNQPIEQPTPEEVRQFLSRLKGISFRPGSKSFDKLIGGQKPPETGHDETDGAEGIKGPGEVD